MQPHRDLVVVGASAGGIPALMTLLGDLPGELPMTVLVVVHCSPDNPRGLAPVLNRHSTYPVSYARDGEEIVYGKVYVAPPDHHLTTEDGHLAVRHGPREDRFRPAVDRLFRSAAESHGERVIGVVLSGSLDDGALGLAVVKGHGGIAIVQSEADALVPQMPANAAHAVAVDHVLPAARMGAVIASLVGKPHRVVRRDPPRRESGRPTAAYDPPPPIAPADEPTGLTCPDCGGALRELHDRDVLRYRCHVGHGMTSEALARAQMDGIEKSLWRAVRALEEHAELRQRMALRARVSQLAALAHRWETEALESERRADNIRCALRSGVPGMAHQATRSPRACGTGR